MERIDEITFELKTIINDIKSNLSNNDVNVTVKNIDDLYGVAIKIQGLKEAKSLENTYKAKIVTLCGSTRFKDAYIKASRDESLAGNIVLSVGLFGHHEDLDMDSYIKKMLDLNHLQKIDMSDEILVLNVGGYIGDSTEREIKYARSKNKKIRYLEPINNES